MDLKEEAIGFELDRIRRIVRLLTRPPIDVDQLTQDIWIEAWQRKLSSVPYALIKSRCYDELRRLKVERDYLGSLPRIERAVWTEIGPSDYVGELAKRASLSPDELAVVFQRFYLDQKYEAISQTLKKSLPTVEVLLKSALNKMRAAQRSMDPYE